MKKIDPQITQITQIFQRVGLNLQRVGRLRDGALRALSISGFGIHGFVSFNLRNLRNLRISLAGVAA